MYFEFPGTNTRLMGSLHAFPATISQMPDWARSAYDWCEILVIESDPPTLFPFFKSRIPNGLNESLSPACWAYLSGIWKSNPVLPQLDEVTPWAACMFAAMFVLQVSPGIEGQFIPWAMAEGKPIQVLEVAPEIVAAFETAPFHDVCRAIEMLPTELPVAQLRLDAMYRAWADRDLTSMESAAASAMLQIPSLREAVLTIRNRAWATKIRSALNAPKRTLISVGALHLLAPSDLLDCIGQEAVPVAWPA